MPSRAWLVSFCSVLALGLGLTASAQQAAQPTAAARDAAARQQAARLQAARLRAAAASATKPPAPPARPSTAPGPEGTQPLVINWTAAEQMQRSPLAERGRGVEAKFVATNKAQIDRIQIPVLLPGDPDLAANLRIFPNGAFYTASSTSKGMAFSLSGAGRAYALSPGAARSLKGGLAARVPAGGVAVESSETGIDAGFSMFGVAYTISLECAEGQLDARCRDSAYVKGVISRLTVALPAPGGG